jgi:hypothetical protein
MKYRDGTGIHLSDKVIFEDGSSGIVVFSIDSEEYSPAYPESDWAYLGSGVMVLSESCGLIHYTSEPVDFERTY